MSLTLAGFSATFYIQVASCAGILFGGWLADSWSRRTARGRLLTQVLGLGTAAPFLFLIGVTGPQALLIAALVVFGLGRGLYDCNTMPVLAQIAQPELRSTGYGIFNFSACISGGAAGALAGYLKSTIGLGVAFQAAALLLLLSATILIGIPLRAKPIGDQALG